MQGQELSPELQAKLFRPGGVDTLFPDYISRQQADPEKLNLLPTDYRAVVFSTITADIYNFAEEKGNYVEVFRNHIDAHLRQKDIKGFIRESDPSFDRSISDREYLTKLLDANDTGQVNLRKENVGVYEEVQRLKSLSLSPEDIKVYFQHRVNLEAGGFLSAVWGKALEAHPVIVDEEFNAAAKSIEACIYDRAKVLDDPLKPNFRKVYGSTIRMVAEGVRTSLTRGNIITDDAGYPAIEDKIRQAEEARRTVLAVAEFDKLPKVKAFIPLNTSGESHIEVLKQTESAREAMSSAFSQICVEAYDRGMQSSEYSTPQQRIMSGWMEAQALVEGKLLDEETFKNVAKSDELTQLRMEVEARFREYNERARTAMASADLKWAEVGKLQDSDALELAKAEMKLLQQISQQIKTGALDLMQQKDPANITKLHDVGRDLGILDVLASIGNFKIPGDVLNFQTNSRILQGWEITEQYFLGNGRRVPIGNGLPSEATQDWKERQAKQRGQSQEE